MYQAKSYGMTQESSLNQEACMKMGQSTSSLKRQLLSFVSLCLLSFVLLVAVDGEVAFSNPVIINPVGGGTLSVAHGSNVLYDFNATGNGTITFSKISGPAASTINPGTGLFSWATSSSGLIPVTIRATDNDGSTDYAFAVDVTNNAPFFTNCPAGLFEINSGDTFTYNLDATDTDPDPIDFSISVAPQPVGGYSIDAVGVIIWTNGTDDDVDGPWVFTITANDGQGGVTQCVISVALFQPDTISMFGLTHISHGAANLTQLGERLVVSNLGSSGLDGFSIDLGESQGWDGYWIDIDSAGTLPQGATLRTKVSGTSNGEVGVKSVVVTATIGDSAADHYVDYSEFGSTTSTIEFYLNGTIVDTWTGHPATSPLRVVKVSNTLRSQDEFDVTNAPMICTNCPPAPQTDIHLFGRWSSLTFPDADPFFHVEMLSGTGVMFDEIRVTPENPTSYLDTLTHVDIDGTNVPFLNIVGEALRMFDNLPHGAMGSATLLASSGSLIVSNIGSSGNDGVLVDLGSTSDFVIDVRKSTSDPLPNGSYLKLEAFGQIDTASNAPIMSLTSTTIGDSVDIEPDFSNLGSDSALIELFRNDSLVYSGSSSAYSIRVILDTMEWIGPMLWLNWFDVESIEIIGVRGHWGIHSEGNPVPGGNSATLGPVDRIHFSPVSPLVNADSVDWVEITGASVGSFLIASESTVPPTAPIVSGDADGNGIITISDAVFLIQYIFAGGPSPNPTSSGDADCSGVLTISDVVYLINYIFAGGPAPCGAISPGFRGNIDSDEINRLSNSEVTLGPSTIGAVGSINGVDANTDVDLAGVQLEFAMSSDQAGQISAHKTNRSDGLQLFSGYVDGFYRVGLVDLGGKNVIAAGDGPIVTFDFNGDRFELRLDNAIVCDRQARDLLVKIDRSEKTSSLPTQFELGQNYPNPFNPSTEISFSLPTAGEVRLDVLNLLGQTVKNLSSGLYTAGCHKVTWDGTNSKGEPVASGIYFYRLSAEDFSTSKKMMLLK